MPPVAKFPARREVIEYEEGSICDGSVDADVILSKKQTNARQEWFQMVDYAGNIDPKSPFFRPCETILARLKRNKRAHWDVGGIIIDYDTARDYDKKEDLAVPSVAAFPSPKTEIGKKAEDLELGTAARAIAAVRGALSKLIGENTDAAHTSTATATNAIDASNAAYDGGSSVRAASSLGALLSLDLSFLRPKFIVCRIHRSFKPYTEKELPLVIIAVAVAVAVMLGIQERSLVRRNSGRTRMAMSLHTRFAVTYAATMML